MAAFQVSTEGIPIEECEHLPQLTNGVMQPLVVVEAYGSAPIPLQRLLGIKQIPGRRYRVLEFLDQFRSTTQNAQEFRARVRFESPSRSRRRRDHLPETLNPEVRPLRATRF